MAREEEEKIVTKISETADGLAIAAIKWFCLVLAPICAAKAIYLLLTLDNMFMAWLLLLFSAAMWEAFEYLRKL